MNETRKEIERRRIRRQTKQTAAERYAGHQQDIGVLIDCVQMELQVHAEAAAKKPKDWGYAGDLSRVRESLKGVLESLLIGRYDWSETETSRFIEDHLEAMQEDLNRKES